MPPAKKQKIKAEAVEWVQAGVCDEGGGEVEVILECVKT